MVIVWEKMGGRTVLEVVVLLGGGEEGICPS
jgi:hypothetical protein